MILMRPVKVLALASCVLCAACTQAPEEDVAPKQSASEKVASNNLRASEGEVAPDEIGSSERQGSNAKSPSQRIADGQLSAASYLLESGGMNIERTDELLGSSHFGQMVSALSVDPKRGEKAVTDQNLLDQAVKESLKVSELEFGEVRSSCSDDVCMLSVGTREGASAIEAWSGRLSKTTAGLGYAAFQSQVTLPNGVTEFRMILSTNQAMQGVTFGQKGAPNTFTVGPDK